MTRTGTQRTGDGNRTRIVSSIVLAASTICPLTAMAVPGGGQEACPVADSSLPDAVVEPVADGRDRSI